MTATVVSTETTPATSPRSADADDVRSGSGLETREVALSDLCPHPANPRRNLGDVRELAESIRADNGLLQPIVMVPAEHAAAAFPEHAAAIAKAGTPWVILLGHRRARAAYVAGADTVPAIVRRDLGDRIAQLTAMATENIARQQLTALEEAAVMGELRKAKWTLERIGEELGCGKGQVFKRLQLLTLAPQMQAAIGHEKKKQRLDIGDALVFAEFEDHADQLAAWRIFTDTKGWPHDDTARKAVAARKKQKERETRREQARQQAADEGLELVNPNNRFRGMPWQHKLTRAEDIEAARQAGTLVAGLDTWEDQLSYYTTEPPQFPDEEERAAMRERERLERIENQRAAKAREAACRRLVAEAATQPASPVDQYIAAAYMDDAGYQSARLAQRWLAAAGSAALAGAGITLDPYEWRKHVLTTQPPEVVRSCAYAVALASAELIARWDNRGWDARTVAHLEMLRERAGYEPTEWEEARLTEAAETAYQPMPMVAEIEPRNCRLVPDDEHGWTLAIELDDRATAEAATDPAEDDIAREEFGDDSIPIDDVESAQAWAEDTLQEYDYLTPDQWRREADGSYTAIYTEHDHDNERGGDVADTPPAGNRGGDAAVGTSPYRLMYSAIDGWIVYDSSDGKSIAEAADMDQDDTEGARNWAAEQLARHRAGRVLGWTERDNEYTPTLGDLPILVHDSDGHGWALVKGDTITYLPSGDDDADDALDEDKACAAAEDMLRDEHGFAVAQWWAHPDPTDVVAGPGLLAIPAPELAVSTTRS